jgi:hypothetical protein
VVRVRVRVVRVRERKALTADELCTATSSSGLNARVVSKGKKKNHRERECMSESEQRKERGIVWKKSVPSSFSDILRECLQERVEREGKRGERGERGERGRWRERES